MYEMKSIDFLQSTRCFSYKFVRNSLKFYQQTEKNPRDSDSYVQHSKILNLLIIFIITVAAGKILIFHLQRKQVCEAV